MIRVNPGVPKRVLAVFTILLISILITAVATLQIQAQSPSEEPRPAEDTTAMSKVPAMEMTVRSNEVMTPTATPTGTIYSELHLPIIFKPAEVYTSLPAPKRVSGEPPIDFDSARAEAQAKGLDITFNKIGFHVGIGGNREGLIESITELDAAGVPVFLKTVNDAEPVYKVQEMMKASGVPHVLVYRDVRSRVENWEFDLPPEQVAQTNWQFNKEKFPPELEPSLIWLETINEIGKIHAPWLAEFSLAQAKLAVADGYNYAAFSWSPGEPEPEDWELPEMLDFLRYAGENPDRVAIALHEYSLQREFIASGNIPYPWLVGRFQKLFAVCDKHDIPRPTVLITEWGWEYAHIAGDNSGPDIDAAMEDIEWAAWLYAAYPQVKGAAIWYLGESDQFGTIDDEAQQLIAPVHDFSRSNYYIIHPGHFPIDESMFIPVPPTSNGQ